ncbi:MAG: hypothetical protein M1813_009140 [Trichoglossum hirsutum]|nr:MAG: hypothetical protein M1813_009140 [Trichoglossum hirsutum]
MNPLMEEKLVVTTGSSSTSLSSHQQRPDNRQSNAPAETRKLSVDTASTLSTPRGDNRQNALVKTGRLTASTTAIIPALRSDSRQNEASAVGGEILANTAKAIAPLANFPTVNHIGKKDLSQLLLEFRTPVLF